MQLYEKALPMFDRDPSELAASDVGAIGEYLVSIGISQWETGRKEDALRTTIKGAQWMNLAVDNGQLTATAMSIPYSNLASMHKSLGNTRQASEFAELAAENSPRGVQRK